MRIVIVATAILAIALAGCGQRADNASEAGLPTPGARPGSNAGTSSGSDQAMRQSFRTLGIEACVSSARNRMAQGSSLAPGTDFRPACTCYIDRVMAGLSTEQLARLQPGPRETAIVQQCGREYGLIGDGGGK